jgi:hypothetical protein
MAVSNTDISIADSLRMAAEFFDEHPEVKVQHAFVRTVATDRGDLERLAAALRDRATERLNYIGTEVEIVGCFGVVRVVGGVPVAKLANAPVVPEYTPIINGDGER